MSTERSILLSKFEKLKGYSSELFQAENWIEFNFFVEGYKLAIQEAKNTINNL